MALTDTTAAHAAKLAKREAAKAFQEANTTEHSIAGYTWLLMPATGRTGGAANTGWELVEVSTGYTTYHYSPEAALEAPYRLIDRVEVTAKAKAKHSKRMT